MHNTRALLTQLATVTSLPKNVVLLSLALLLVFRQARRRTPLPTPIPCLDCWALRGENRGVPQLERGSTLRTQRERLRDCEATEDPRAGPQIELPNVPLGSFTPSAASKADSSDSVAGGSSRTCLACQVAIGS
jgi:hypothetical protein